jgi:myo-inositol-1(or 4)-monophosphatase
MHEILNVGKKAARAAGQCILDMRGAAVDLKASNDLLTEADLEAQKRIIDIINSAFPNHHVMAEEGDAAQQQIRDDTWIVDPLDGTNNFVHGVPQFSVSIAYSRDGRGRAGVVYDPVRDEMFCAGEGTGAFLNDSPIAPSHAKSLEEAIVAFGFYYDRSRLMKQTLQTLENLLCKGIRGVRRFGSAALDCCWVACGRFDAFFEYHLSPWDFAAGTVIAREAGARVSTCRATPLELKAGSVAVVAPGIYNSFLDVIAWEHQ